MTVLFEIKQDKLNKRNIAFSGMQVKLKYEGQHNNKDIFILLLNDIKEIWIKHPRTIAMYANEARMAVVYWQDYYDMCNERYHHKQ